MLAVPAVMRCAVMHCYDVVPLQSWLCKPSTTTLPERTCAAPVPSTAVTSADSAGDTRRGPSAPPRAMAR